jgi:hypothetical protein
LEGGKEEHPLITFINGIIEIQNKPEATARKLPLIAWLALRVCAVAGTHIVKN